MAKLERHERYFSHYTNRLGRGPVTIRCQFVLLHAELGVPRGAIEQSKGDHPSSVVAVDEWHESE